MRGTQTRVASHVPSPPAKHLLIMVPGNRWSAGCQSRRAFRTHALQSRTDRATPEGHPSDARSVACTKPPWVYGVWCQEMNGRLARHPDASSIAPTKSPQKALSGGIPCPFLEPLARSWSHFVGIYRQKLKKSSKNDFWLRYRRALRTPSGGTGDRTRG